MRLAALSTHVPPGRIATEEIVRAAGGSIAEARVFERLFGLSGVAAAPTGHSLGQAFEPVIEGLSRKRNGALPDTLILVRGLPGGWPGTSVTLDELKSTYGLLSDVSHCFQIDQANCCGLFWALDLARVLLDAEMAQRIVVLAGDTHAGLSLGNRYVPGCTLMGDAFCGLILDRMTAGTQIGAVALHSNPEFSFGFAGDVAQMGQFFAAHSGLVQRALDDIGFDWTGPTPLLPHNVNRFAWQVFSRETGVEVDRIRLGLLPDIGHCYTCDPFLLLDRELDRPAPAMTLVSVGMGGFVGACQLTDATSTAPTSHQPSTTRERP